MDPFDAVTPVSDPVGGGPLGGDPLARQARERPDAPAVEFPGGRWTFAELDAAAARAARRLEALRGHDRGTPAPVAGERRPPTRPTSAPTSAAAPGTIAEVEKGRPLVAALLPRTPEAVAAIHGSWRAGAILAPLHLRWTDPELEACVGRLRPTALLHPRDMEARAARMAPDAARLPLEDLLEDVDAPTGPRDVPVEAGGGRGARRPAPAPRRRGAATPPAHPDPGAVHSVLATSGSAGRPGLVALSPANHLASARGAAERLSLHPGDRWLASLELSHVGGLALAIRAVAVGCRLVLRERFDPEEWNALLDEGDVTHASLVPTMLRKLLDARGGRPAPASLDVLLLGGAATDPGLLERALAARFPVALTYGLTEAASQVATAPPALVRRKPGTAGPPLPGTEVRIDPAGEILVRGPTVMRGYWDEPAGDRLRDGWLRTGDLGRLDEEGHLRVIGRRSHRIVTGGVNVDPGEVEAVLAAHPAVREAAVVGLPDAEWGERVAAAVEPAEPFAVSSPELEDWCRGRLAGPKRPRAWSFFDALPRTPTGKPDREAIRRSFEA